MPSSGVKKCADRKSTRLNSSHTIISYAVFCLKKKSRDEQRAVAGAPRRPRGRRALLVEARCARAGGALLCDRVGPAGDRGGLLFFFLIMGGPPSSTLFPSAPLSR